MILLVEDLERAVEFYGQSLRLEAKDGEAGRYAEFDAGDGSALLLVKRDGSVAPMAAGAASGAAALLTFTIPLEGCEAWKKWLVQRGVPIERETIWVHGGRSLYLRDPDGRKLEFKTPPVAAPPKPVVIAKRKDEDG